MTYKAPIKYNKRTGQAIVFLSKKKLNILKEKRMKYLKVEEDDLL